MAEAAPSPERRHRIAVRALVAAASIFAFLAIFTAWIDRQALHTEEWVETSGKLLEDEVISDAVADYAVDQLFAEVDVSAVIEKRLPDDVKPLAGPVAGGLREFSTRTAERALRTDRVQNLWQDANRVAHAQLLEILEGDSDAVSTTEGEVVLDLRPIILQLAEQVGIDRQIEGRLPEDVAELQIAEADQLDAARTITRLVKGLAWLFTLGSVGLFALAVYLATGRRWMVVFAYGIGLVAAGLAAIAVRGAVGELVVDEFAQAEAARAPTEHAWEIGTSLLDSMARSLIAYGVLFAVASFLASPAPSALTVREALAPILRDRRGLVWGVFAAIAFLYLISSPPEGLRQLLLTLALIALAGAGLEALSRRTAAEFPDARRGEWLVTMRRRARSAGGTASRRIGSAIRELGTDRDPEDARIDRLERLGELRDKGILTPQEFDAEKQRLMRE